MTDRSNEKRAYPPDHLSPSSVGLLTDCGKLWELKYKKGVQERRSDALVLGSAFDAACEWFLRQKWAGVWVTGEQMGLRFGVEWDAQLARPDPAGPIDWGTRGETSAFEDGLHLATSPATLAALRSIKPAPHPDNPDAPGLQVHVQVNVPGVSVPVIGWIDCLAEGPGGTTVVIDFKTARRAWARGRERKELQARIYLAALWQAGTPIASLRSAYWVFLPGITPEGCRVQKLDPLLDERDILLTLDLLRRSWRQIEAGTFVPNSHSFRCNERCPGWSGCFG